MWLVQVIAVLLFVGLMMQQAHGVVFDVQAGKERCIYDVLGKEQLATGEYAILGSANDAVSVDLFVTGPGGQEIHSKAKTKEGKFGFTAARDGEHRVCFLNRDLVVHRVSIRFRSGVEAKDLSEMIEQHHLKPISTEVLRIEETVRSIFNELLILKQREKEMREMNDSINSRVTFFSCLSVFIVTSLGCWQVLHLKNYFRAKKLI